MDAPDQCLCGSTGDGNLCGNCHRRYGNGILGTERNLPQRLYLKFCTQHPGFPCGGAGWILKDVVEEISKEYPALENKGSEDDPTIIVIMNESFADLSVISHYGFETTEEVTPFSIPWTPMSLRDMHCLLSLVQRHRIPSGNFWREIPWHSCQAAPCLISSICQRNRIPWWAP